MEGSSMMKGENKDCIRRETGLEVCSGGEMMKALPLSRVSYTSLRDMMPLQNNNCASWNEIPIKNPLLKHAALAYLQPMSTPSHHAATHAFFRTTCFACLSAAPGFFNTLFHALLAAFFCGTRTPTTVANDEPEDDDDDDDDDDDVD